MSKKIAICSNTLWSITNFREELILALISAGYEISVIGSAENIYHDPHYDLKELNINPILVPVHRSGYNLIFEGTYFFRLLRIFKKTKPDIVLFFSAKPNIYGSMACRILKIPFINTITGLGSGLIHKSLTSFILKKLYSVALKGSCRVLFQNSDDEKYFLEKKIIGQELAGYVPGSGLNVEKFTLPFKETTEKRTFLFAGRLLKDKGVYEYIKAIEELKKDNCTEADFLLGGFIDKLNPSGISSEEIKKWEDLNIIRYIGKTDHIMDFFKMAEIIVLPSYREGLSRILLEAASCKKALITTDVPGCKDIVRDGFNGFLCKPKDVQSLKEAMIRSLNASNSDLQKFGYNGREIVMEKFRNDLVDKVYLEQINKCLTII